MDAWEVTKILSAEKKERDFCNIYIYIKSGIPNYTVYTSFWIFSLIIPILIKIKEEIVKLILYIFGNYFFSKKR